MGNIDHPNQIDLKTDAQPFWDVYYGFKTFEIRYNDRDYKIEQVLMLRETKWTGAEMRTGNRPLEYTGNWVLVRVIGIMHGPLYGLLPGWVILSIKAIDRSIEVVDPAAVPMSHRYRASFRGLNLHMNKPELIALTGPAGSGKSTVSAHLMLAHDFTRMSFAAPLYRMVAALEGMPVSFVQRNKAESYEPADRTRRFILQTLGTEWGRRMVHQDLWVRILHATRQARTSRPVVIDDLRFENEASYVRGQGGLLIHLKRSGLEGLDHKSENGVSFDPIKDVILHNDGSITDLLDNLDRHFLN